jgi:hypothetical protein
MTLSFSLPLRASGLLLLLPCASCLNTHEVADPTILIHSPAGTELGVSTDYGTVFLGRFTQGGEIDVTAWFGDGPSLETSVVEPLGAGLFTAETEIRLPAVRMTFEKPANGTTVTVRGRAGNDAWSAETAVRTDERVDGVLLRPTGRLDGNPDQIGAGVFIGEELEDYRLLGLVSGRIELVGADGTIVEYVTVVGPTDLWRIVAHRRDLQRKTHWVYRDDIL